MRIVLITLVALWKLSCSSSDCDAAVLHVPSEHSTISGALQAATSGDSVVVTEPDFYLESVVIPNGVSLLSFLGRGEVIILGDQGQPVVTFGVGQEQTVLAGFSLDRFTQFDPPTIVSYNPNALVADCIVGSSGPDLWGQPALVMERGGAFRGCEFFHQSESAIVRVVDPGVEVRFEDCLFWEYVFPTGLEGFPQGTVLRFDHCTFRQSRVDFGIYDSQSNVDFDLIFENSIFYNPFQFWARFLDSTVPTGFFVQYNCWWPDDVPAYGVIPEQALGPGNFSADPMFCVLPEVPGNPPKEAWLESDSPCIEAASDGSNVGARWGVCGVTGVGDWGPEPTLDIRVANPVSNQVLFTISDQAKDKCLVTVRDVLGRLVVGPTEIQVDHGISTGSVDLEGLPAGSYFLRVHTGTQQVSRKFVVFR